MKTPQSLPSALAVAAALALASCSGENTESMLASAKSALAANDHKAAVIQVKNALQKNPDLGEARFLLGKALLQSGDAIAAEVELRKALALKYTPDATVPLLAAALLRQGQAKKLAEEFAATVLSTPEANAELLTTLATAQAEIGKSADAEETLKRALAAKGDHLPAQAIQARFLAMRGDLDAAGAVVDGVLGKNPASAEAWKLKGDVLLAKNDADGATAAYRKAVEAKPELLAAHASLVSLLLRGNKEDEAARQLEALKKLAPKHPLTLYLDANIALHKKEVPRARELVQQLLKNAPDYPPGLQLAASIEYRLRSYVQAEVLLGKLLRLVPENVAARQLLAVVYLRLGQPKRAMNTLAPLAENAEQDPKTLALLGEVAMQNGDVVQAEQYFVKANRSDPKNLTTRTALAMARLGRGQESGFGELEDIAAEDTGTQADMALIATSVRTGQFDKALKAIDTLQKKMPEAPLPFHMRGGVLAAKKDVVGARRNFEEALRKSPDFFPSASALATLDLADKKPEEAKKRFESVLAKNPKSIPAMLSLAALKQQQGGSVDEVAGLIGKAVAANPGEADPRLALIEFHARNKDFKRAISAAQEAVTAVPDNPQLYQAMGMVQMAGGETNQALASYNKLAGLQPSSPLPHLRIAEAHLASKNREAAIQSLRKALEIKPDLPEAQRGLVALLIEGGAVEQAVSQARDVQKQRPGEAIGYLLEGDARAATKSWNEAVTVFRAGLKAAPGSELAVKLHLSLRAAKQTAEADKFAASWIREHPKDFGFRLYLGESALRAGDVEGASRWFKAVVDEQPNNAPALNNLAWVSARLKNAKALEYAERAYRLAPNNPAFMDTLAMILFDKGEVKRAKDLLVEAARRAPEAPIIHLNLAKVLIKAGDKAGAREQLDKLAKLGDKFPGQAEVQKLLKEL